MGELPSLLFVRFRSGIVRESHRTVHIVPAPDVTVVMPTVLTALCGQEFTPGSAERLDLPLGMPCNGCLALIRPGQPPLAERTEWA